MISSLWLVVIGTNTDHYCIVRAVDASAAIAAVWALPRMTDYVPAAARAEPTDRAKWTIGKTYRGPNFADDGPDVETYTCIAYDWRTGWWMQNTKGQLRDVSERAIGRTYHEAYGRSFTENT